MGRKRELAGFVGPLIEFWEEVLKDLPSQATVLKKTVDYAGHVVTECHQVASNKSDLSSEAREMYPDSFFSAELQSMMPQLQGLISEAETSMSHHSVQGWRPPHPPLVKIGILK